MLGCVGRGDLRELYVCGVVVVVVVIVVVVRGVVDRRGYFFRGRIFLVRGKFLFVRGR